MDYFQHIPGPKGLAQYFYHYYVNFMPKGLYKFATSFLDMGLTISMLLFSALATKSTRPAKTG